MHYKKLILIPVVLGVMVLSLILVKRNQEIRRGAAGGAKATIILSPETVTVEADAKFEISVTTSSEATVSAIKLMVCHMANVEIEKQESDLSLFNMYLNKVDDIDGNKCEEVVMTGMTSGDKLPNGLFKLFRIGFVAKTIGSGVVRVVADKSNIVGPSGPIDIDANIADVKIEVISAIPIITSVLTPTSTDTLTPTTTPVITDVLTPTDTLTPTPTYGPDREWWTCDGEKCVVGTNVCNSEKVLAGECFYGTECPTDFCKKATATLTPTQTSTPTPTPIVCKSCEEEKSAYKGKGRSLGDYNCDGIINLVDFNVWRNEGIDDEKVFDYWRSDGDCKGSSNVWDYSRWRENYLKQ